MLTVAEGGNGDCYARPDMSAADSDAISVVYIEDDLKTARLMAKYLDSHGSKVTIASDPRTSTRTGQERRSRCRRAGEMGS